jgi:hypothetical protein
MMKISPETWAIVAATGLGPIAAVIVTFWRDAVNKQYERRLHVFRTLMSTRKIGISIEHVNAVNLARIIQE